MSKRSGSSLFLMEQLIVILIFSICAAACVKIFVDAYLTTNQAKDISNGLLVAESGAETYKAVDGDIIQMAEIMGGISQSDAALAVYYNSEWQPCAEAEAAYVLRLSAHQVEGSLKLAELTVQKSSGEELAAFMVAAGGGGHE